MDQLEARILDREICLLADEAIKNQFRFDLNDDTPRTLMSRAQVVMLQVLMEYLMNLEDWSEFEDDMWDNLDLQRNQYREARAKDDRHMATIYLSRVRLLTRLLNRLSDFKRHQLIGLSFDPVPPGGSPPPLGLHLLRDELKRRGEL